MSRLFQDYLPIGSIVTLKLFDVKFMIVGQMIANEEDKLIYDYRIVEWPQGYRTKEKSYLINHTDIDGIYFIGMQDVSEFDYVFGLDDERKLARDNGFKESKGSRGFLKEQFRKSE